MHACEVGLLDDSPKVLSNIVHDRWSVPLVLPVYVRCSTNSRLRTVLLSRYDLVHAVLEVTIVEPTCDPSQASRIRRWWSPNIRTGNPRLQSCHLCS